LPVVPPLRATAATFAADMAPTAARCGNCY